MIRISMVGAILWKDFKDAILSHTLVLVLVGPVVLSLFFVNSFSTRDIRRPKVAVYDPDHSGLTRVLKASGMVQLQRVESFEAGRRAVQEGDATAALAVPHGFDSRLLGGEFPVLRVVIDGTLQAQSQIVRLALRSALREQVGQEIPADIRVDKIREVKGGARLALLPVWVVFTLFSAMMVTASTLVEEREQGTWEQVLCAPVSAGVILVGKLLTGFTLAFTAAFLICLINGVAMARWGLWLTIALGGLLFAALGVVIGLMCKGQTAANSAVSAVYMVMFIPVAMADISRLMASVAAWSPAYYLYEGINLSLSSGADIFDLFRPVGILLSTLVVVLAVGCWKIRLEAA